MRERNGGWVAVLVGLLGCGAVGDEAAEVPEASDADTGGATNVLDGATDTASGLGDAAVVAWSVDGVIGVGGGDVVLDVRAFSDEGAVVCVAEAVQASVEATDALGDGAPATLLLAGWPQLACAPGLPASLRLSLDLLTPDLGPAADRWGVGATPGLGVFAEVDGVWRPYGVVRDAPIAGQAPVRWVPGAYAIAAAYALPVPVLDTADGTDTADVVAP